MLRIIIILLIAVLILTAFLFPQFRRSLWTTLVVVLCVLAGIIWFDHRQRELHQSRFSLNQVELLHMEGETRNECAFLCGEWTASESIRRPYHKNDPSSGDSKRLCGQELPSNRSGGPTHLS